MVCVDRIADFDCIVRQRKSLYGKGEGPVRDILKKRNKGKKNAFDKEAQSLLSLMRETTQILRQNKRKYMSVVDGLSNSVRDEIDQETRHCMESCHSRIEKLKHTVEGDSRGVEEKSQVECGVVAQKRGLVALLYERLHDLSEFFGTFRAFRYQQSLKNYHRPPSKILPEVAKMQENQVDVLQNLDEDDMQMLQQENEQLQSVFDVLLDEVKRAETQLTEISHLSHILSTQISEQEKQIDYLYENTVQTSVNIRKGNENLEQAAANDVYSRFNILIFFLTISFVLLFLNYYYD